MGKYVVAVDPVRSVCLLLHRGMDVYNQHFGKKDKEATDISHDQFYTNNDIVDAFSRYVATIVKRYANEPTVLGTPLSIIYCIGHTNVISRLGTCQRPTLFLRSCRVEGLHTADHY